MVAKILASHQFGIGPIPVNFTLTRLYQTAQLHNFSLRCGLAHVRITRQHFHSSGFFFFDHQLPAGDVLPIFLFPFQIQLYQRVVAKEIVWERQRPIVVIGMQP